jgi:hypothetical protein
LTRPLSKAKVETSGTVPNRAMIVKKLGGRTTLPVKKNFKNNYFQLFDPLNNVWTLINSEIFEI